MISKEKAAAFALENSQDLSDFLAANFPQTIKDGTLNLKAIAALLGINANEKFQGYELTFPGKGIANELYKSPTQKELKLTTPHAANSLIIGDNLDALKILKSAYDSRIKMIYIDPPYNTKNENFIYPDDFRADEIFAQLNIDKEAQNFFKNITGTRSHTGWLAFMLPRLKLARDLLRDDGVIFISIDDNEQANLKLLCDEIFGEENFVGNIIWHKKDNASFLSKNIVNLKEYILFYCKDINKFEGTRDKEIDITKHRELINKPSKIQNRIFPQKAVLIQNGKYTGILKAGQYGNPQFGIEILKDTEIVNGRPLNDLEIRGKFAWSQAKIDEEIANGGIIEIKTIDGMKPIFFKNYDDSDIPFRPILDILTKSIDDRITTNHDADKNIKEIFGASIFDYSKPYELIKMFINSVTTSDAANPDIILDFFAGSGTTAHAVMALNAADGGNRQFILVQLPEPISEQKSKTAYDFVKNELGKGEPKISDITIERIKRAGKKLKESVTNAALDTDFAIYELDDKPSIIGHGTDLALQDHRSLTPHDLARNLATKAGVPLGEPLETVIKNELFRHKTQLFVAAFSDAVLEVIKSSKEGDIFIDAYAFSDDDFELFLNILANADKRLKVVYE